MRYILPVRRKLYDYVVERPGGATSAELLNLLFSPGAGSGLKPNRSVEFNARFLRAAIGTDPHFRYDPESDCWHATVHSALQTAVQNTDFVVIDLETTGLNPASAAITEIAAVRIANGRVTQEFHTLVNPGRRIPAAITRLTGITDDMVRNHSRIDQIFPQLHTFFGAATLVAHNADFDLGFLNFDVQRLQSAPLLNQSVCTLRLAKRLLTGMRSRSLDAVASHLGVSGFDRHRALGDARITAEVFLIFLEQLSERGIKTLGQLIDFQHSARDGRRFTPPLPRPTLTHIPDSPGVYRLLNNTQQLLYIGKAKNLRRRVSSYFVNSSRHSDKVLDLVRNVHEVSYEQTGSELEAALREAELIRTLKPPYNTLSKHLPRVAFLKLTVTNPYPRLSLATKPTSSRALYVGPFRNRDTAEKARRLLARLFRLRTCTGNLSPDPSFSPCVSGQIDTCSAPCNQHVTKEAYQEQVKTFRQFLDGQETTLRDSLIVKRDQLAAGLRFEAAARLHKEIELLDYILHIHRQFHWIITRAHAFVLLPSREPSAAQAYLVLNGRLVKGDIIQTADDIDTFAILAQEHFNRDREVPLRPEEIDASVILAAWLRDPERSQGAIFPLDSPDALAKRSDEILIAVQDLQGREPSSA